MSSRIIAKRYFVSGDVQGVGFRFFTQRAAQKLGVAGFVRNLFDGRVEVYAVGDAEQLKSLRAELRGGPLGASVSGIAEEEASVQSEHGGRFSIEYDA